MEKKKIKQSLHTSDPHSYYKLQRQLKNLESNTAPVENKSYIPDIVKQQLSPLQQIVKKANENKNK